MHIYIYTPKGSHIQDHLCYLCLVCVKLSRLFIAALWSPAEKAITFWLSFVMFHCVFFTFPCGILGQVRCLIVAIPDLCHLSYFQVLSKALDIGIDLSPDACLALTSYIPLPRRFNYRKLSIREPSCSLLMFCSGFNVLHLTVTFRATVVSLGISRPSGENCTINI